MALALLLTFLVQLSRYV